MSFCVLSSPTKTLPGMPGCQPPPHLLVHDTAARVSMTSKPDVGCMLSGASLYPADNAIVLLASTRCFSRIPNPLRRLFEDVRPGSVSRGWSAEIGIGESVGRALT